MTSLIALYNQAKHRFKIAYPSRVEDAIRHYWENTGGDENVKIWEIETVLQFSVTPNDQIIHNATIEHNLALSDVILSDPFKINIVPIFTPDTVANYISNVENYLEILANLEVVTGVIPKQQRKIETLVSRKKVKRKLPTKRK